MTTEPQARRAGKNGSLFRWLAVALLLLASGCVSLVEAPPPTQALQHIDPGYGYRFTSLQPGPDNSDGLFLVLAFSGGGTRSGALAYGVLDKLRATAVQWEGRPRRLLDEVDVINGVSGGSYAAAYYGLYREAFFEQFPERFLHADLQTGLWDRYVSVMGLAQFLGWARNDRIDHLGAILEQRLFGRKTFADLLAPRQRPLVVIHATDLALGSDFQFTQDQLDPLCIDLSTLPVARAVAASSAVPILFGPVTLRNHAGRCGYIVPSWVRNAGHGPADQRGSLRAAQRANDFSSYLDANDATGRPWIHLTDGGVSDNLGLRGALESGVVRGGLAPLLQRLGLKGVRKVAFVLVGAEVLPDLGINRSSDPPSIRQMASAVVDAFMNNSSFETQTWLRTSFRHWRDEAQALAGTGRSPYAGVPEFYLVEAHLRELRDPEQRQRMMAVPTAFRLDPDQIKALIQAGRDLLDQSAEFQRLVKDLQ